ncbi:MAG: hypothetical protein CMF62_02150 [Magnetococcales bacterium]|nr:hypothetical protein [Magnetococcales bacterium]|tara:strand:+ start:166803 stop:169277 length:2475 start_codon:yes stop_codon:yes gene_type:complete
MGIERFFSSVEDNKIANLYSKFSKTHKNRIIAEKFYIDFNSIIHITSKKVVNDLNTILYNLIIDNHKKIKDLINYYSFTTFKNYKEFKDEMTDDKVSNIIINEVIQAVYKLLEYFLVSDQLEYLYIAIDGVPNRSKMEEQRKRRYMGYVISGLRNKIFEKHEEMLKKEVSRYIFETNKITWSKNYITPGTIFMENMQDVLKSVDFELKIKEICPNIKTYIFDGTSIIGEGEKKIVDVIRKGEQKKGNYVIYSPDSDVSLLALLLNNKFSPVDNRRVTKLKVLRHNQQKNNYDVIDIDTLAENIYLYVTKNTKIPTDKSRTIDDVVFIFTVFGNDFLPKVESINVKYDFDKLVDIYIDIYNSKKEYLIKFDEKNKVKIFDQDFFIELMNKLKNNEGGNLQKNYMSSHFRNYDKLRKLLNATSDNFNEKINNFLNNLRNFNNSIRNNKDSKFDDDFIEKLKLLTRFDGLNTRKMNIKEFIDNYKIHYERDGKFPKVMITFFPYSYSINNPYHQNNVETSLDYLDPKLKITDYDREIYQFENMLDSYKSKLNSKPLDLGKVYVNPKNYTFQAEKIIDGVTRFYETHFSIENINSKNMDNVIYEYVFGLMWVFDYYYNSFDFEFYQNNLSLWHYPYSKAPLITQIHNYLDKNKKDKKLLPNITKKVKETYKKTEDYFNCVEHLLYVSPAKNLLSLMPNEYYDFIKQSDFYIDLDTLINEIWNKDKNDVIDCVGVMFLNKCLLKLSSIKKDPEEFLKKVRKVTPTQKTLLRSCKFPDLKVHHYKKLTTLNKINNHESSLFNNYKYYKRRYLHTNNLKYKKIYKRIKKQL